VTTVLKTSSKTSIGKLLRIPLRLIPQGTQLPVLSGPLKGKKWIVGSSVHGCWLGNYEKEIQTIFQKHLSPGKVAFDIGANVGFYTLLASTLVGTTGKVVSFEPVPRNIAYLKEHMRINQIQNVTVLETALSDNEGFTCFDEGPSHHEGRIRTSGTLKVSTTSLDALYEKRALPLPHWMKIDVEGAEYSVFAGSKTVINLAHPTILLSTHGYQERSSCLEWLSGAGYSITPLYGVEDSFDHLAVYNPKP